MEERTFSTKRFAELVKRQTRTLYIWEREGKLIPKKDFNGRNIYTLEDYEKVMGRPLQLETEEGGVRGVQT